MNTEILFCRKNKSLILVINFLLIILINANAQLGINAGYAGLNATEWSDGINENTGEEFSNMTGYQIGVDYRLRIKNVRIEFLPTISYSSFKESINTSELKSRLLGFHLYTLVYLFDLEGDCDCPTWSKSGNIFQKGFFLEIAPGINSFDIEVDNENKINGGSANFIDVGVGVGLDIGLSDYITISPSVRYHLSPETEWALERADALTEYPLFNSFPKQLYAGVRLAFNFKN